MKKILSVLGLLTLSALMAQFAWAGGVLLVDDDLSDWGSFPDVRLKFTDALETAGFTEVPPPYTTVHRGEYQVYNVISKNGPGLDTLQLYDAVIWFTGTSCCSTHCLGDSCITGMDEKNLGDYLDLGGRLFLSAQDYLESYGDGSVASNTFARDYLKLDACSLDVWQGTAYTADGTDGSVTEGFQFELEDPFNVGPPGLYMDQLERIVIPNLSFDEFLISDGTPTGYAAISYKTGDMAGDYKVFFTTISFAALKDAAKGNTKGELMKEVMAWLLGDYGDYGDAPDPPFCSYFESIPMGAIHVNSIGLYEWLGDEIDLEFNTWQVDNDLYDDGVSFYFPYEPGLQGSVAVKVCVTDPTSTRYYDTFPFPHYIDLRLYAWFDWYGDGDWYDYGPDSVIVDYVINPVRDGWTDLCSTYTITFQVPADATEEDTIWTRFRLTYDDDLDYYECCGYSSWGEVEDYKITTTHLLNVGLSTFYASAGDGQATLYWTTESEVNNLGFYLLRSEAGGEYVRVNEKLIPGYGTSESRREYSYVDQGLVNGVTYNYKLVDVDLAGTQTSHGPISVTPQASVRVPTEYALSQNYPNPFNARTTITYAIPKDSKVSLKVFNVVGEEVRTLVDGHQKANTYQATWDGRDADGKSVASGVYFCTLEAGEFSKTTKMVFMK